MNIEERQPHGHWTVDEGKNLREFFDHYAQSRNLDPLDPESWYSISQQSILAEKVTDVVSAAHLNYFVGWNISFEPL